MRGTARDESGSWRATAVLLVGVGLASFGIGALAGTTAAMSSSTSVPVTITTDTAPATATPPALDTPPATDEPSPPG